MNPPAPVLETERLQFRPLAMNDLNRLAEWYADPEVMRYVGVGRTRTREETRAKLTEMIEAESRQGYGVWATVERASGTLIGRCGLMTWEIEGQHELEVVYLFARPHWGRGFATDAAIAIRDYGFETLRQRRLICLVYRQNRASRRVATKAGFRYRRRVFL
ncbi:MAG: GNAT family N-acetyltransferase [Phycisphaerae bacterium]|nr:GNAT family N-acetyltransferase [Phycisphaerae bacterium]